MAPAYKFNYFDVTALGEVTRWLFAYANIDFENEYIPHSEWPQHKDKMPFGQMPILHHKGKMYNQSLAIARYAAKQAKLVGANDLEELEIDGAVFNVDEFRSKIAAYAYEKDETRKASLKGPLLNETLPFYLERLDKIAKANNGHLACNKLTWADFYFASILDYFKHMLDGLDFLEKYENLRKVRDNVINLEAIQKWISSRAKVLF